MYTQENKCCDFHKMFQYFTLNKLYFAKEHFVIFSSDSFIPFCFRNYQPGISSNYGHIGRIYTHYAALPYLQPWSRSHFTSLQLHNIQHSQYLKPHYLTCLLSALHQGPQYHFWSNNEFWGPHFSLFLFWIDCFSSL
jgi:hypothetical protein